MKISKFINVKVTKSARGLEKSSKLKVGGMYLVLRSTLIYLSCDVLERELIWSEAVAGSLLFSFTLF